MYTYSEIEKAFQNCNTWMELEKVSNAFYFLIKNKWISGKQTTCIIYQLCDQAFRRIENLPKNGNH